MENQQFSPSEIVMLQLEIRRLNERVISLEQERFLLTSQIETLKTQLETKQEYN